MGKGLLYCSSNWEDTFCIAKLVEALISSLLIGTILIQVGLDIRMRGGLQLGFTQAIQILMLTTLTCNLAFCINHELGWFYYSQSFFYDWYFSTLVFYVTYRIIERAEPQNLRKLRLIKIGYVIVIAGFFSLFVYSGIAQIMQCKQIWFLVIDVCGLLICSVMIQIGCRHHKTQTQKFIDFRNEQQINNPLSKMWTLILINLFCQLTQLTESLIFLLQSSSPKCSFSNQITVDTVIKLLFSLFSLHLSFVCTVIIFHLRRKDEQNSTQIKSKTLVLDVDHNNLFQMMEINRRYSENDPHSI